MYTDFTIIGMIWQDLINSEKIIYWTNLTVPNFAEFL